MVQLIYGSTATQMFSNEQLLEILHKSSENNRRRGLTGMLVYAEGSFLQVLEGEEAAVTEAFERIKRDPRHRGIVRYLWQPINERNFGDWSMSLANVTREECLAEVGLRSLSSEDWLVELEPSKARRLLESFRRSVRV